MTIKEMMQERAKLINEARKLLTRAEEEKRELTAEEETRYNKIFDDANKLKDKITREEQLQEEERKLNSTGGAPFKSNPDQNQNQQETRDVPALQMAGFRSFLMGNPINQEFRALQADVDASGGYMVAPEQFINDLIQGLDNFTYMTEICRVLQVNPGTDTLGAPYMSADVANPAWTTEIDDVSEDSTLALGKRTLTPHQLTKLEKVSMKLLRVSAIPAESLIRERFEYKFGVVFENGFLNGTGSSQPLGVFTASDDGISTGRDVSTGNSTTAIAADNIQNVKYSLKAPYRVGAKWIYHRDGVKMISKLKDGEGQYLWKAGLAAGDPDTLAGYPVLESEYAPNTFTTGKYVGVFGNFDFYWVAMMMKFELQRLNELYAANSQVGFIGRAWADGMPVDENAFARVTLA